MKLTKIEVKQLFGVFDHSITLKTKQNITILIGENGLGKTVILEAINSFFSKKYGLFYNLDFSYFQFSFDNNETWKLTKKEGTETSLYLSKISDNQTNNQSKEFKISSKGTDENEMLLRKRLLKEREYLRWKYMDARSRLGSDHVDHINQQLLLEDNFALEELYRINKRNKQNNPPKWFEDGVEKINVQLIETQRLITLSKSDSNSYINNVNNCSRELQELINDAARKASDVTLSLDSTYPNRLIEKLRQGSKESFEELNTALIKLDKRRKKLSESGLVVDSKDSAILQISEDQKDLVSTLKLYVDDSHLKLDPYDELATKIILFKEIINKRFKHKNLVISQDKGMSFLSSIKTDKNGSYQEISTSKLSSGEQNELILFFKLIFNGNKGDLILIDEPELSLHISWQNNFIKDLKEVTSINDVSVIIATHSPDIIDENWDLRVELKGLE